MSLNVFNCDLKCYYKCAHVEITGFHFKHILSLGTNFFCIVLYAVYVWNKVKLWENIFKSLFAMPYKMPISKFF